MQRDGILEKNKPYHVIARAVERRTIFPTKEELDRFMVQMYIANFGNPFHVARKDFTYAANALLFGKEIPSFLPQKNKTPLVRNFSFALVGNHYHFGFVGSFDDAISKYMQRLNIGFAKYFNLKHKRSGSLFETRFRAVAVTDPKQLVVLLDYINIKNVIDVYRPNWSQKKHTLSLDKVVGFLQEYPYSSFADIFLGRESHIIDRDTLYDICESLFPTQKHNIKERIQDVIQRKGISLGLPLPLE